MKLPRWLVIGLISTSVLMPVLAACLWIFWPVYTAMRLNRLLNEGRCQEANTLTDGGEWVYLHAHQLLGLRITNSYGFDTLTLRFGGFSDYQFMPTPSWQSAADAISGRQETILYPLVRSTMTPDYRLVIMRGRVVVERIPIAK